MSDILQQEKKVAEYIRKLIKDTPQIAIVLGSGLGTLADEIENAIEIDYKDIPGFPRTTVAGHDGKLIYGTLSGKKVIGMKGRFHYYEGHDVSNVTFAVKVFKLLGIENIFVTNAAGGINKEFKPGDLMLIKDHISFFAPSPLRGQNIDEFGPRFPDMSEAYSKKLINMAKEAAESEGISLKEGVYAFTQGPMYETPAEIRALSVMGADAVGMSTVPEVITARHAGMKVLGISCITNMAAGILDKPLSHQEVMDTAREVESKFKRLVRKIVEKWEV